MPAVGNPGEGAGPGQSNRPASDSNAMQLVRFASAQDESEFLKRLAPSGQTVVRLRSPEDDDVEGHILRSQEDVVLATMALDDDVQGHVISIHFPDADKARHFRNQLLAAGALTASVALGVGVGGALSSQPALSTEASSQAVWMNTGTAGMNPAAQHWIRGDRELTAPSAPAASAEPGTAVRMNPAAERWMSGDKELVPTAEPSAPAASAEPATAAGMNPAAERWMSGDKELTSTAQPSSPESVSLPAGTNPAAERWVSGDEELTR